MVRGNLRETGMTIASVVTAVGGLALAYTIGNHIDNGHLLVDLISWNPYVDPIFNIAKYGGEAIGATALGGAFSLIPPLVDLGVSHGKSKRAERRLYRTLRQRNNYN